LKCDLQGSVGQACQIRSVTRPCKQVDRPVHSYRWNRITGGGACKKVLCRIHAAVEGSTGAGLRSRLSLRSSVARTSRRSSPNSCSSAQQILSSGAGLLDRQRMHTEFLFQLICLLQVARTSRRFVTSTVLKQVHSPVHLVLIRMGSRSSSRSNRVVSRMGSF